MFNLDGQVFLVTGATTGIGLSISQKVAEAGGRIVVSRRNARECAALAGDLNSRFGGDIAAAAPSDIRSIESFVRGARHSSGDRAIVCLRASRDGGRQSNMAALDAERS